MALLIKLHGFTTGKCRRDGKVESFLSKDLRAKEVKKFFRILLLIVSQRLHRGYGDLINKRLRVCFVDHCSAITTIWDAEGQALKLYSSLIHEHILIRGNVSFRYTIADFEAAFDSVDQNSQCILSILANSIAWHLALHFKDYNSTLSSIEAGWNGQFQDHVLLATTVTYTKTKSFLEIRDYFNQRVQRSLHLSWLSINIMLSRSTYLPKSENSDLCYLELLGPTKLW